MMSSSLAALLLALSTVSTAHMSPYMPSMYADSATLPPSTPIGPDFRFADWWMRGENTLHSGPTDGAVSVLPAGGSLMLEITCNQAFTSSGVSPSNNVACPDNNGAYHAGDPTGQIDYNLLAGCALAIADVDDINLVTKDNLAIFSVQKECVWKRDTTFQIPAQMPPCTGNKCICTWMWEANNGTGNFYMTPFDCKVTGSPATATPIKMPLVDPKHCPSKNCTGLGAQRPIYFYNADYSNIDWIDNNNRPGYNKNWGFNDGPQNDIFSPAGTPLSTTPVKAPAKAAAVVYPLAGDLALSAVATASSFEASQKPQAAIDGVISGYVKENTGNETAEWASDHGLAGTWLLLTWKSAVSVDSVVMYDRPNWNDHCYGGTLEFSDKSVVAFGSLDNGGAATAVNFTTRSTTFLRWTCTDVSPYTSEIGLTEIQVYGPGSAAAASSAISSTAVPASSTVMSSAVVPSVSSAAVSSVNVSSDASSRAVSSVAVPASSSSIVSAPSSIIIPASSSVQASATSVGSVISASSSVVVPASSTVNSAVSSARSTVILSSDSSFVASASASSVLASTVPSSILGSVPSSTTLPVSVSASASASASAFASASVSASSSKVVSSVASSAAPVASAPSTAVYSTINLAFSATVKASSQASLDDAYASRAVDGVVGGYLEDNSGDETVEWSSDHGAAGTTWYQLTWTRNVDIAKVVLYDRPNANDQVTGGTLKFSDGTVVQVGALPNDGSAFVVTFPSRSTRTLLFTVTSISASTSNVGLAEIQAFALASSATAAGVGSVNWARYAKASASSASFEQYAYKAIDGSVGGYTTRGGDYTREWASDHQLAGATLLLTWNSPVALSSVVLYDRPNTNDWVKGSTITFSDGGVISIPQLKNDGTATYVNFPSITTSTLLFTVTSTSSTSSNIGLSELMAFSERSTASGATSITKITYPRAKRHARDFSRNLAARDEAAAAAARRRSARLVDGVHQGADF